MLAGIRWEGARGIDVGATRGERSPREVLLQPAGGRRRERGLGPGAVVPTFDVCTPDRSKQGRDDRTDRIPRARGGGGSAKGPTGFERRRLAIFGTLSQTWGRYDARSFGADDQLIIRR